METISFDICKEGIFLEVARTTAYIGAKGDVKEYDRVAVTDADDDVLKAAWDEAAAEMYNRLRGLKPMVTDTEVSLSVGSLFDEALTDGIKKGAEAFFAKFITAKWLTLLGVDATAMAAEADACLENVARMVMYKKKPTKNED